MKKLHFKNKQAYRKWLAYGHMKTPTGLKAKVKGRKSIFQASPGNSKIIIGGKLHKVKHKR